MKLIDRELTPEMIEAMHERGATLTDMFQAAYGIAPEVKQEPVEIDWPEYNADAMGCGLEDRCITDRYDAMRYGWDEAIERCAEIAKRDARIETLEIRLSGFSDLTGLMQSSLEGDTSRISELLDQNEEQAAEITRLKAVIAKCEAAIDSHLNPCGCFNGCEFCSGKESLEEALAAIKEKGL